MIAGLLEGLIENLHVALKLSIYVVGLAAGVFCLVKFCDILVDASGAHAKKMIKKALLICI